jgi:hypothetical protein
MKKITELQAIRFIASVTYPIFLDRLSHFMPFMVRIVFHHEGHEEHEDQST